MKRILIILAAVALMGCHEDEAKKKVIVVPPVAGCEVMKKLTNEEIIQTTQQCESAGLQARSFHCGDDPMTTSVQCEPK